MTDTEADAPEAAEKKPLVTKTMVIAAGAVVAGLIVGGAAGWGITASAMTPTLNEQQATIQSLEDDIDEVGANLSKVHSELADAKDATWEQGQVESRERAVAESESAVADREKAATAAEEALKVREAATKAAEESAWWIPKIRECLNRPGSYRMATVTEGSLGPDTQCMSG